MSEMPGPIDEDEPMELLATVEEITPLALSVHVDFVELLREVGDQNRAYAIVTDLKDLLR